MTDQQVSATRTIPHPPEEIFALLASPAGHTRIDGSDTIRGRISGPEPLVLGSRFFMKMRMGPMPYRVRSTVVEYEENRLIAWAHFGKHRWRYELEPVDAGTNVTETFDWSTAISPKVIELAGYPKRHPANMEATLARIEEVLDGDAAG